jgi:hypothetical protein
VLPRRRRSRPRRPPGREAAQGAEECAGRCPAVEAKPAKTKLVRDSFTIPKSEYSVLVALKERAIGLAHGAKKSELLRAGIQALSALGDAAFLAALKAVPSIKTGRPKSRKASDA